MKKQIMIITLLLSFILDFTALSADSDFYVIPIKKTSPCTGGGSLHVIDANGADRGVFMALDDSPYRIHVYDQTLDVFYEIDDVWTGEIDSVTSVAPYYYESTDCTGQGFAQATPPWVTFVISGGSTTVYKCTAAETKHMQSWGPGPGEFCSPDVRDLSVCTASTPVSIPSSLPTPLHLEVK